MGGQGKMKRGLYYLMYLMALLIVSACTFDLVKPAVTDEGATEGKPVTITFSVPGVRIAPSTKSLEDGDGAITGEPYLDPNKLFLVVCGGTQSIKYVRKAEMVVDEATGEPVVRQIFKDDPEFADIQYPVPYMEDAPESISLYSFRVQLELSDSKRTIHFLGNIDENQLITGAYSYQILPYLLSYEGKQAYWQKLVTSITADDTGINPETGSYTPDEATINSFKYVPLIRNYAEIKVTNVAKQFKLHSYAVIFTPKQGSVVPYRHNLTFDTDHPDSRFSFSSDPDYRLSGYEKCTIDDLEQEEHFNYPGNLPSGVSFTTEQDIPSAEEFLNPSISNGKVLLYDKNAEHGFYVYEREIPSDTRQPTFIILCGRFMEEDEEEGDVIEDEQFFYYRLDLIDSKSFDIYHSADYYPIYRNFRYDIHLNRVASIGVGDPLSAYQSTGAENISADISMRHLSDISNGISRLVVDPFMAHTFTGPNPNPEEDGLYVLYVRFFDDVEDPTPNVLPNAVQVTLEPIEGYNDDIVILYNDNGTPVHTSYPRAQIKDGEPGFRIIRFNLKEPTDHTRTQIIKITGRNSKVQEEYPLYREVEITLQRLQEMRIDCDTKLYPTKGSPQTISISIPDNLNESMFPLDFIVEAQDMTLTPIPGSAPGNNLPVRPGKSLSGNGKNTFYFIRTLTWSEYKEMVPSGGWRTFECYFKSNRNNSATTIWVYNEFFNLASKPFENEKELMDHFYVQADDDEGCFVRLNNSGVKYRRYEILPGSDEWTPMDADGDDGGWKTLSSSAFLPVDPGQRVAFKYAGEGNKPKWNGSNIFYCRKKSTNDTAAKDGVFKVGGNIASLIVGDRYAGEGQEIGDAFQFTDFFKGHVNMTDASELVLPMLTCQSSCYKSMFDGCTSLVSGPRELPATKTAYQSYRNMFKGCSSLINAPEMADAALSGGQSYTNMFDGCSSLARIVFLGTQPYNSSYFNLWVNGVSSTGVFVTAGTDVPIRNAYRGTSSIPVGWTVLPE